MIRSVERLAQEEFDLLIIGGGIYGATAAWDAALRGIKVALIEKNDFASGASSNSLKIIHGGLRYLQHLDIKRMRESIKERRILSKIAPHLIFPLACAMPTKGHMTKGPEAMRMGLLMNDLISIDRNRGVDENKRIPCGKALNEKTLSEMIPHIDMQSYNGGVVWYDAQMYNSERLVLSFLHSAVTRGASVANYVHALEFDISSNRVKGVRARDRLNGKEYTIRAKTVLNCAGYGLSSLLAKTDGGIQTPAWSTALNLVLNKSLNKEYAFGVYSAKAYKDKDALISKGSRLLFLVPWRGITLAGTDHKPFYGKPETYRVSEADIQSFLAEIRSALPNANIHRSDVAFFYSGLLPMAGVNQNGDVQLLKHFELVDHEQKDGVSGLISVYSVKYTTARGVSEKAIDLVQSKLNRTTKSTTAKQPIWGGEIEHYEQFVAAQIKKYGSRFDRSMLVHLMRNYGSAFQDILAIIENEPALAERVDKTQSVIKAEVLYAVRHEMAKKLSDVVLRRTELGTKGYPNAAGLAVCADLMTRELQWNDETRQQQISETEQVYKAAD